MNFSKIDEIIIIFFRKKSLSRQEIFPFRWTIRETKLSRREGIFFLTECRDAAPSLIFYARDIFLDGFHRFRASDVAYVGQGKALVSRGIRAWQVLQPRHGGKFPGFYREKFRDTVKPRAVERRRVCIDISGFRMRNTPTLTHTGR